MKYQRNRAEAAKFLKSAQVRVPLNQAAHYGLARMRADCPKDSGNTAATGYLTNLDNGGVKGDRAVVRITFGGKAVANHFGNKITRASRFMTRWLSG